MLFPFPAFSPLIEIENSPEDDPYDPQESAAENPGQESPKTSILAQQIEASKAKPIDPEKSRVEQYRPIDTLLTPHHTRSFLLIHDPLRTSAGSPPRQSLKGGPAPGGNPDSPRRPEDTQSHGSSPGCCPQIGAPHGSESIPQPQPDTLLRSR